MQGHEMFSLDLYAISLWVTEQTSLLLHENKE